MNDEIKQIIKITNEFLSIPSTITNEQPFLKYLNKKITQLGYKTIQTDRYLIVKPKINQNPLYLFSTHIDRHGFIKNENNSIEYIAYYLKKKLGLKFHKDYYDFYLSCAQRHTREEIFSYDENGNKTSEHTLLRYNLDWKQKLVTFDIKKELGKCEKIFAIKSKLIQINNKISGQIDNVISAAVLFYLLKTTDFEQEIIFTTQEEIGKSFECVIEYLQEENKNLDIITLDTTPYENFNGKEKGFIVLRKGDENGSFNLELVENMHEFLESQNIPIYYKPSNIGMTELGRISTKSSGKYNGATIQIPSMNYHTSYETTTIESLENYLRIIEKLSKKN